MCGIPGSSIFLDLEFFHSAHKKKSVSRRKAVFVLTVYLDSVETVDNKEMTNRPD